MESVKAGSEIGSLREDIGQQVPFTSAATETMLTLERASDELLGEAAALLKSFGVTVTQFNALRIVRGAGPMGISTQEVGRRLIKRDPDVPRLLERMAAAGLVKRQRCAEDRRVTRCMITEAGAELLEHITPRMEALHQKQFAMLLEEEQVQLVRLLDRVRERLKGPCAEAREEEGREAGD